MLETLLNCFIDLPFTFFHCSAGHCLITLTGLFDNRTAGEVRRLGRLTAPISRTSSYCIKVSHFVKFKASVRPFLQLTTVCFAPPCPFPVLLLQLKTKNFPRLKRETARVNTEVFCLTLYSIVAGFCFTEKREGKIVHYHLRIWLL